MANRSPESGRQWVGQLLQQSVSNVALKSSSNEDRRTVYSCDKHGSLTLRRPASGHGARCCRGRGGSRPTRQRHNPDLETKQVLLNITLHNEAENQEEREKQPWIARRRSRRWRWTARWSASTSPPPASPVPDWRAWSVPIGPGDAAAVGRGVDGIYLCARSFLCQNLCGFSSTQIKACTQASSQPVVRL
jgi:hypothetical protein